VAQSGVGRLAQHGLAARRELLQSLGEIDRVAYQRIFGTLVAAYERRRDQPGGKADAKLKCRQSCRLPAPIQL